MTGPASYPFPEALNAIPRDRSAAIEASAGTGKTYLIEHLVVDRVVRGEARLEEILVVTFTERAAAELLHRIRALIDRVARQPGSAEARGGTPAPGNAWTIDGAARARLREAARGLDLAPISTIHAFCHRILTEHAFAGGRLFAQAQVESRTAFALAFADVLRRRLATDPALMPYLEAWLAVRRVDDLETLLYKARQLRCDWEVHFDPDALERAAAAYGSLSDAAIRASVGGAGFARNVAKAVIERLLELRVAALAAAHEPGRLLAKVDGLVRHRKVFSFVEERLGNVRGDPAVDDLLARLGAFADAAVPLDTAVAQLFGPLVEERLATRKRAAGHYDFDDMLLLVAEALHGPKGADLVATLRGRLRLAIIDEFQDTDPVQWDIFRTIFADGDGSHPLYVIGDPKQSIYGFRGADIATYASARDALAAGAPAHALLRNFRSSAAVIDAYNAILDQSADPPFFTGEIAYQPVICGRAEVATPDPRAPLRLLRITAEDEKKLPMRAVRAAIAIAIADEIVVLRAEPDPPPAREIFVLTRTRRESEAVAAALGARGVPHVLCNQPGLYDTSEARHVRDLLRAIADPHDPEKRLRAWLTPFFGLSLSDLPGVAAGTGQPLVDRLLDWHATAETDGLGRLLGRVLDDSGVVARELFVGENLRRLTNYQHLFEIVAGLAAHAPISEVVRRLSALVAKIVIPAPEEGNELRVEGEREAVQIMTMHKAKGLEADVVFVYGGFGPGPTDPVRTYTVDRRRVRIAGRPRRQAILDLVKRERNSEDQRLLYVALTRARRRLYLPYSGNVPSDDSWFDGVEKEDLWKLTGGYRFVNQRLRALVGNRDLCALRDVPVTPTTADDEGAAARAAALRAWRPEPAALGEIAPDPELAHLRRHRAGTMTTSYSRIKQAHGGYRPPTEILDEAPTGVANAEAERQRHDELPGGARTGIFLHELLEKVPLATLAETPGREAWAARDDIAALVDSLLRKHGREMRHRDAAARLAHAALTAPLPVVGGWLPGLPQERVTRELEFLFPFPDAAGGPDRGFVKGFVDVIFEHEGRTYFGDWKTDTLPRYDADLIAAHVAVNYALQEQLYALALVRMLGITDEASYEARFGGMLYVFVRGLPGAIRSRRPRFADLEHWNIELVDTLADAGGVSGGTP